MSPRRPTRRLSRAARRAVRVAVASAVVVALAVGAAVVVYVLPGDQEPRPADVVYVIGPVTEDRMTLAEQLIDEGVADALMISTALENAAPPEDTGWEKPDKPEWAWSGSPSIDTSARCAEQSATLVCMQPEPFTTQGEAQDLATAMHENGWETAIVVTVTTHVARTRLLFDRCIADGVQVLGVDDDMPFGAWLWQFAYQTGGFVKALATPGC